jgi:hypothetical protein
MTKTVSPFFPKRNLIQICLLDAVACLNSLRRAAGVMTRFCTLMVGIWLATTGLAANVTASDPLVDPGPEALTNTLAQIAALQAEARALSPTQKKIATSLRDALREFRGDAPRPYAPKVRSNHRLRPGGKILVDIRGNVSASLLASLRAQGATILNSFPQYESIRADIPIAIVETIAANADVKFIRPAAEAVVNVGTATSEGYYAETVDQAQTHFGVNGSGVNVGVLSSSSLYLNNSQASGDLGSVTVLPGQSGIGLGGSDEGEGTAMLEIVHDLAPGAQLYFATGFGGEPSMASNIIALADSGCSIIIDDVTVSDESPFHQNQPISQAVKTVSDRGILYFSSAANSGNLTHGTSGTWTGNFSTYGFDPTKGQLHNWGGTPYNQITKQDGAVNLFWSDPMGGATNDYDLFITDVNGNVKRQAIDNTGNDNRDYTGDPYEAVAASTNSGEYVVVALASGAQRDIWVGTGRGRLAHATAGNTRGHNAASAANAFSVAATTAHGFHSGVQFFGGAGNPVENFSSDGFPRLFYETDGSAVTPNDLTASGGRVLLKPDITAADGVIASTNTFGTNFLFTPFYGTSAAAPHAGAIAALIKSYRPDLTPYQIRLAMMNTALDIESLGFDLDSGAGIVMADAAMISVDNTPPVLAVISPANNSILMLFTNITGTASDIGSGLEGNQIHFTLYNHGNFWSGTYWTNTPSTDPSIDLTASVFNGAWTFTSIPTGGAQVQGPYFVSASARDNAGNTSDHLPGVNSTSFTIDRDPPAVTITFPPDGSTITNQPSGNWFQGNASDNPGNNLGISLFIRRNSDNLYWTGSGWGDVTNGYISNTYTSGNQTWQSTGALPVPGSSLGNGYYHFIAIAVDAAGNRQQVDSVVSVDFHPTYVFTAGSYNDINPANHNMRWDNFENWDVGSVPTTDARVVINNYTPDNTSLGSSLQLYRLELSGGTLTTSGMLITNLNFSGGTLSGGVINIPANGVVNLTGSSDKTLSVAALVNSGMVIWNGGNIVASYGSAITNSGIFVIQSSGFFYNDAIYGGSYPLPVFVNSGWLLKTVSNGETIVAPDNGGWTFYQNGTIDVENGALSSQSYFNVNGGAIFAGPGETRVDAGTAVLNGTNTIQAGGTVELAGGTWGGKNVFTGPGTFVWSGGTLAGTNTIGVGANLAILGAGAKTLTHGKLVNAGNGVWTGAGAVNCSYGSLFENDGTFTVQNDSLFYTDGTYGGSYPPPVFVNNGSFTKTNSTGTTDFNNASGGVAFNNHGSVTVQSGTLTLGGGGASANDSFAVAAGSAVDFYYGSFFFNGNLTLLGGGTNRVNGATVTFNFGTNTIGAGSTFEIASGTVEGTNTVAGVGTVNWSGGTIAAMLTLQANIACNLIGSADKTLTLGTLINNGTVIWTGGNLVASSGSAITNNATFVLQNSGLFDNYGTYAGSYPPPVFVNNGLLQKTISNGETIISPNSGGWVFYQNGTLDVENGALSSQSQFYVTGGAIFAGPGETRVDAGTIVINGTNTIQAGGTVELAGGVWSGNNIFTGPGTFVWSGGTLAGTNTIGVGANLAILGAGAKTLTHGKLVSAGNGVWTGAGAVNCSYGSLFENDGTFTVQNDSLFYTDGTYGGSYPPPVFVNNGSFTKTNSTGTTDFNNASGGVAFNNHGSVTVQSGTLTLGGGGASANDSFAVAAGSAVDFYYGSFFFNGNLTLLGGGTNRVNGATVTFNFGTNTIGAGSTFEIASGTVEGTNTVAGVGTVNWSGGTIAAMLTLQANIACNLIGSADKTLTLGTLINNGTVIWTGGNLVASSGSAITNNATFVLQNSGLFDNYGTYAGSYPPPVFVNNGLLQKTISNGETIISPNSGGWVFYQNGTLDVENGALSSQSQFYVTGGAIFAGPGETRVDAGTIVINGTNTIQAGGTVELAGGVWSGNNIFTGPGTFVWSGGTLAGTNTIGVGANLAILGAGAKTLTHGKLVSAGNGVWTGAGAVNCSYGSLFENDGTFTVQNDSLFYTDGTYSGSYPLPMFVNNGTFRKNTTTGTTVFAADSGGVNFNNHGLVDLQTGILAINGGYTLSGSTRLNLVLGGVNPGTQFSQETFAGSATLGGLLSVTLTNGFSPTNGQSFAIVTYASESGQFDSQRLPALPNTLAWQVNYGATAVTLDVLRAKILNNASRLANGHFQFSVDGPNSSSVIIQGTTNLVDWVSLQTNAPFTGSLLFDEAVVAAYPGRFYRAIFEP